MKKTKHFVTVEQKINVLSIKKCLGENFIYKATIRSDKQTKNYLGSTGVTFKKRWYNYISDFKNYKENGT